MNELILSYSILEFFCWNPHWDKYLTALMEENKKQYEQSK
jgi:hypothetical protein